MLTKSENTPIWLIWLVLAFFGLQAGYDGLHYVFGDPELFSSIFREKYVRHLVLVRFHAISGVLALGSSLLAFLPITRRYFFHRYLGRVYIGSVLAAGLSALPMGMMAAGSAVSKVGFLVQALLWLGTAAAALNFALRRRFREHRRWMVRSFSVTYGAVVTRLLLHFLLFLGLPFHSIYDLVSWSWLLPMAAGEIWILISKR